MSIIKVYIDIEDLNKYLEGHTISAWYKQSEFVEQIEMAIPLSNVMEVENLNLFKIKYRN
jgi:hypothetical protein